MVVAEAPSFCDARLATPAPGPLPGAPVGASLLRGLGARGAGVTGGRRLPPKSGLWVRWWRSLGSSRGQWGFGWGWLSSRLDPPVPRALFHKYRTAFS